MKVLIGVDGSVGGFAAVRQAGRLMDPARDQAVLYYTPPEIRVGNAEPEVAERAARRWPARFSTRRETICPTACASRPPRSSAKRTLGTAFSWRPTRNTPIGSPSARAPGEWKNC